MLSCRGAIGTEEPTICPPELLSHTKLFQTVKYELLRDINQPACAIYLQYASNCATFVCLDMSGSPLEIVVPVLFVSVHFLLLWFKKKSPTKQLILCSMLTPSISPLGLNPQAFWQVYNRQQHS